MPDASLSHESLSPPTEGLSHQHWLLITTDRPSTTRRYQAAELFHTRVADHFWGFSIHTPNRHRVRPGDRAIIYLGGRHGGHAVANCLLASAPFPLTPAQRLHFSHNETAFWADYGVHLHHIDVWLQPVPFTKPLIHQLTFIKNKERWGTALQGTLIPIPAHDYQTILAHRSQPPPILLGPLVTTDAPTISAHLPSADPVILLGHDLATHALVSWSPLAEKNPHLLIVGMSGAGKTETLKALIYELHRLHISSIILDLHNEFTTVSEQTIDLSAHVKLNPLELTDRTPLTVVYEVAAILRRIYHLGDQQEALLRMALKHSYQAHGITHDPHSWQRPPPSFSEVKAFLENLEEETQRRLPVRRLLNRLEPLFDMEIFGRETYLSFRDIVTHTTALQLRSFPTDAVKTAVSDFLLRRLWHYTLRLGAVDHLRFYVVLDEAHRLAYDGSPLEPFLREARKYGVGILLSSQRPTDFSENILANVAATACLQCPLDRDARYMAQQLTCHADQIKALTGRGEAIVKFASSSHPCRVQVIPLFQRHTTWPIYRMRNHIPSLRQPESLHTVS